jgi:hypothetical protein
MMGGIYLLPLFLQLILNISGNYFFIISFNSDLKKQVSNMGMAFATYILLWPLKIFFNTASILLLA